MRKILVLLAILAGIVLFLLCIAGVNAYRPQVAETLYRSNTAPSYSIDSFTVTSWNIGYAGMDSAADFFMDGGTMVRNSRSNVENNINHIATTLQTLGSDIFLLQEVDSSAHRSYHINQFAAIQHTLANYFSYFALNFNVSFVPIPVREPIGQVKSGLALYSRWQPKSVERLSYPSTLSAPRRWFDLQRCFMVCRFALANSRELVVINTHNSAFDNGSARSGEMQILRQFLLNEYALGNFVVVGGDWNQTPPQCPQSAAGTPQYTPLPVPADFLPAEWTVACDIQSPTVRFANRSYKKGISLTGIVDFFVLSPNIILKNVKTVPHEFAYSDHEAVVLTAKMKY